MTPEELLGLRQVGYEEVPPGLSRAARRALAGKKETKISLTSGGQLSRWAAAKRKARRKMAKESRRKNRGK
jgi:hypothetical protein